MPTQCTSEWQEKGVEEHAVLHRQDQKQAVAAIGKKKMFMHSLEQRV